jgi:hypothetical protein
MRRFSVRLGLREQNDWSLPPELPRQGFFTKEIRRLLQGGGNGKQSPVLPRAWRAYDACLSSGSTAVLPHCDQIGAPIPSCTELNCLPNERIADNAFGAMKLSGLILKYGRVCVKKACRPAGCAALGL